MIYVVHELVNRKNKSLNNLFSSITTWQDGQAGPPGPSEKKTQVNTQVMNASMNNGYIVQSQNISAKICACMAMLASLWTALERGYSYA